MNKRLMLGLPVFIFFVIILISCSENIHDKIYISVKHQIKEDSCGINFNELFQESWELLFIVEEFIMPSEISNAIGFEYSGDMVADGEYRFIITDGEKVLRESSNYFSQIVFNNTNSTGIVKISVRDTFCAEYNTKIIPHFYLLKKKGGW